MNKVTVRSRFNGDQKRLGRTNFFGRVVAVHFRNPKIFAFAANIKTSPPNFAQISAHQEMHVASAIGELGAVITPDRSRTDDADFHLTRRPLFGLAVSCNQPRAFVETEISPGPLEKHGEPSAEADEA